MAKHPLGQDCTRIKNNGEPCKNRAIIGATVCRFHGGAAPQVKKKAAERIAEAAHDAAALLVQFMEDPKNDVKVRTQIAQDLLNRAGYAGKQSMDLTLAPSVFDEAVQNGEFLMDIGEVESGNQPALASAETIDTTPEAPKNRQSQLQVRKRRKGNIRRGRD